MLEKKIIHLSFSDGAEKSFDFAPFIKEDKISKPLSVPTYFKQVEMYENSRGIYWPNG